VREYKQTFLIGNEMKVFSMPLAAKRTTDSCCVDPGLFLMTSAGLKYAILAWKSAKTGIGL